MDSLLGPYGVGSAVCIAGGDHKSEFGISGSRKCVLRALGKPAKGIRFFFRKSRYFHLRPDLAIKTESNRGKFSGFSIFAIFAVSRASSVFCVF